MTSTGRRWIAAIVVSALVHIGTLGLYHVCAHQDDGRSDGCITCRVVGSSTTVASATARTAQPVAVRQASFTVATESSAQPFIAPPGSRGPPSLA